MKNQHYAIKIHLKRIKSAIQHCVNAKTLHFRLEITYQLQIKTFHSIQVGTNLTLPVL